MVQEINTLLFTMCLAPVFIFFIGAGLFSVLKNSSGIEE